MSFTENNKKEIIELLETKGYILESDLPGCFTLSSYQMENELTQLKFDDIYQEIKGECNIIEENNYYIVTRKIPIITLGIETDGGYMYGIYNSKIISLKYMEKLILCKQTIAIFLENLARNKKTILYTDFNSFLEEISNNSLSIFNDEKKDAYELIEDICRNLGFEEKINLSGLIITKQGISGSGYFDVMRSRGILKDNFHKMTLDEKKDFHKKELEKIFDKYK